MTNKKPAIIIKNGKKYFFRFTVNQRIQHIILAISVVILVLTGIPLKFSDEPWAHYLYDLFGGIHVAPYIHRGAGVTLLLLFVYHIIYLARVIYTDNILPLQKSEGLHIKNLTIMILKLPFIPNLKDIKDFFQLLKYLFFLTDIRPQGDEFTWKEKIDYWAPFWGMMVIGLSGLIMANKVMATKILPGEVINFALIAHSDEALLAALFLFIWHWYNVHYSTSVFPMGTTFVTGYKLEELMIEEHYQYYVEVMKREGYEDEIHPPHGGLPSGLVKGGQPQ